ncbi:MAG: hypothetical protein ACREAB_18595, partial [Blastocatellia bacterium]
MSQAIKSINEAMGAPEKVASPIGPLKSSITNFLPAILPLLGAFLVVAARIKLGPSAVPADFSLIIL